MKQIVQLLVILAIIAAIVMYMQRNPEGFRKVHQETTTKTKYVKEGESPEHHKATETYTKTVKPEKEGSRMTIKEEIKYSAK